MQRLYTCFLQVIMHIDDMQVVINQKVGEQRQGCCQQGMQGNHNQCILSGRLT